MVSRIKPEIEWSTFSEDAVARMAETESNRVQMTGSIFSLIQFLMPRKSFHVRGNQIIYYNPANGRDHISPYIVEREQAARAREQAMQEHATRLVAEEQALRTRADLEAALAELRHLRAASEE